MDLGESLEDTAKRELYEETGLSAKEFEFINVLSGKDLYYQYPHGYNVIALYKAKEVTGKTKNGGQGKFRIKVFFSR